MNLTLDRCTGPACPRCGCQDAEILAIPDASKTTWYGAGRARCRHCSLVYHFRELPPKNDHDSASPAMSEVAREPAKEIPIVTCANCQSEMKVSHTQSAVRRYRCPTCGATAKRGRKDAGE